MENPYVAPRSDSVDNEPTSRLYLLGRCFVASMAIAMLALSALYASTSSGAQIEIYLGIAVLCFLPALLASIVPAVLRDRRWFWPYLLCPLFTIVCAFGVGYAIGTANP